MKYSFLCLVVIFLCCQHTTDVKPVNASLQHLSANQEPTRRQLLEKQIELGEVTLVYGAANEVERQAWQSILPQLKDNNGRNLKIRFAEDKTISKSDIVSKAIYLVGTAANNKWMAELQDRLPWTSSAVGLQFAGKKCESPSTILNVSHYPNPLDKTMPLYMTTGVNVAQIQKDIIQQSKNNWPTLRWSSFGYQIFEKNICRLSGYFSKEDWSIDKKQHWEITEKDKITREHKHFNFIQHQVLAEADALKKIMEHCEAGFLQIQNFTGIKKDIEKIDYHIYADMEDKGMMLKNTQHGHVDFERSEVHVIHHPAFANNLIAAENELILQKLLGQPKANILQRGLGIYLASDWQKRGSQYWAKLLHQNKAIPPLSSILLPERESHQSILIYGAAKASFVAYLLKRWGKEKFLDNYLSWTPALEDMTQLQADWTAYLEQLPAVNITPRNAALPYLQGFNFAHEGYQIFNGYGSSLADQSMAQMVQLGSNALAIVPYSYMRQKDKPATLPIMKRAGNESDESVIQSIQHAKEKNCYVMLKPQIWLGRSWTGFVEMQSEADWDAFFDYYTHWIKHYALLAEIYEADALAVGVEFVQATLQNQDRWASLFKEVRKIYSGHLTYCANWGEEFEGLNFWEELDYIGLNSYYPWSKSEKASKKELKKGIAAIVAKIEKFAKRYQKPIVFTEIGFRSVEHPWTNPHADADGRAFNEDTQAMCYEAFFQAIQNKKWCRGILWWKWPSYKNRQPKNTAFTPMDKAAERVVSKYFQDNQ